MKMKLWNVRRWASSMQRMVELSRYAAGLAVVERARARHRFGGGSGFQIGGGRVSALTGTLAAL